VVFAFVALVAVLHADLVRDAPAHRYQPIGANHAL
jgi:hypothetical protein